MTDRVEGADGSAAAVDQTLVGIAGWLVLPAIGFVVGPIFGVFGVIVAVGLFSGVEAAGYGGVYALEIVVLLGLSAFLVYVATRFFGKKADAPSLVITYMLVSLGTSALLLVVELALDAQIFAMETGKQLGREAIGAAIWISYFKSSKRVRNTFVN